MVGYEDSRSLIVNEAMNALRLSRKYKGRFSADEFEAAKMILGIK